MSDTTKEPLIEDNEEATVTKRQNDKSENVDTDAVFGSDANLNVSSSNDVKKYTVDNEHLLNKSKEELVDICKNMNSYIEFLQQKNSSIEEVPSFQEYQRREKLLRDSSYREKVLIRRLAVKEQEIQEYISQLRELKAAQIPSVASLKSALLDPAVNLVFQGLKMELVETKTKLEETQNELNAWKFTPDSNTGKRLMAKCRLLHQENEDFGKLISSGRVAKLEGEMALQKSFSEEVKKSQSELDDLLQDLDEDVEGMQGTIYYLQQELKKCKEIISNLQNENTQLRRQCTESSNCMANNDGENELEDETKVTSPKHNEDAAPNLNNVTEKNEFSDCNSNAKEELQIINDPVPAELDHNDTDESPIPKKAKIGDH